MSKILSKTVFKVIIGLFICSLIGCGADEKQEIKFKPNSQGLFEGEIVLKEKRGIENYKVKFLISDTLVIREERMESILNLNTDKIAGMIIDLQKRQVVLYASDGLDYIQRIITDDAPGLKATLTFEEYKSFLKQYKFEEGKEVVCYDFMFGYLEDYKEIFNRKNVLPAIELQLDYHLYQDANWVQDIFDSPKINVRKEILPLIFPNIPKNVNFPLAYRLFKLKPSSESFDIKDMTEDEIADMIEDGLKGSLESESEILKIIERKLSKSEVFIDLNLYEETRYPAYFFEKRRVSSGGGFGFGDD